MATKKKTTVEELKELIEATPKANIISNSDLEILGEVESGLNEIRNDLRDLQGNDNISEIMFIIGSAYQIVDKCEDKLTAILDQFRGCDECDDNY
jgi:septation ring formation regulator EzrA